MSNSQSQSASRRKDAPQTAITLKTTSFAFWGAVGSMLVSIALLGLGMYLFTKDGSPKPLNIALLVLALIEGATGFFTLQGKRVAWAFALSINGTCAVVLLFSAPRIRDALSVSLITALLPCLTFGFLVVLQSLSPEEF